MHLTQSIFRSSSAWCVWGIGLILCGSVAAQRAQNAPAQPAETNPIVLSVQASRPSSPPDLARAIAIMLDIDRDDLALGYLNKLDSATVADEVWFELLREFGSDFTFRLATRERIQPVGRQMTDKILDAANRFANDPQRLAELTRQVVDSNIARRTTALENFQSLGEVGAATLLNALADPARSGDRGLLGEALRRMESAAEPPIRGGLSSTYAELLLASIRAAASSGSDEIAVALFRHAWDGQASADVRLAARQSLQRLLGDVPSAAECTELLRQAIESGLSNQPERAIPFQAPQRMWRTHPETKQLVEVKRPFLLRQRIEAAELAEGLLKIEPGSVANERLYALALLEATKYARGFEVHLGNAESTDFLRQAGPEFVESILVDALRRGLVGAAAGACEVLGQIGDQRLLRGEAVRPLVQAAAHSDRRVQFAACEAIMAINPTTTFPGSSSVVEAMISLAQSRGRSKVLVGHPDSRDGQNMAATVELLGFAAENATSPRDLVRRAAEDPDVEYLLLSDLMCAPTANDLIDHLRAHPRIGRLPIAVQYRVDEIDTAWQSGQIQALIDVYLVVDTRQFPDYDDWLKRTRGLADVRMPLLLLVAPSDTDIAAGWGRRDANVRFFELDREAPAIWKGLPGAVANAFNLPQSPVSLVLEPRTASGDRVDLRASLVLEPDRWVRWPSWTRQLHGNLITNRVSVVRVSDAGLDATASETQSVDQTANEFPLAIDDIDFLYSRVTDLISNQDALTESHVDPQFEKRAERLATRDPLLVAVPWTLDRALVARQMDRLEQLAPSTPVTASQRRLFAKTAVGWLTRVSADPARYPFWELSAYDGSIGALVDTSELTAEECRMLGNLGTPRVQQQLADLASENQLPLDVRQAAVAALQAAFERNGILLTSEQIHRQYERYNASENLPEETQQILGSVLDAIERPSRPSGQ